MDDDPGIIEETRRYIRDYDKLAESAKTVRELYDKMLKLYPDGINPHPLWLGARAVKGQGHSHIPSGIPAVTIRTTRLPNIIWYNCLKI
jgi:hypothetical protein